jgi:orotate phosphoribosyltransferase
MSSAGMFWWNMLKQIDAVYECPKDVRGKRLGPLVGYAGKDEDERAYVGDVYANLAVLERHAEYLGSVANCLLETYPILRTAEVFCGAPEGGKSLALLMARQRMATYCYPDQEVVSGTRNKKLEFLRHDSALLNKRVVIVEDVLNNFSTTDTLIELIEQQCGQVIAIAGVLNRSLTVENSWHDLPVCSMIRRPIHQYRQTDKEVKNDIEKGNVVLKPKHEWDRLAHAMRSAPKMQSA